MKTKTLSIISTICFIILFLSYMYFGCLGTIYLVSGEEERTTLLKAAGRDWTVPILCFLDMIALSAIFGISKGITRHGKTIEDIDKKQQLLDESIRKYDAAALKLVRRVLESDFETIPPQIKSNKV